MRRSRIRPISSVAALALAAMPLIAPPPAAAEPTPSVVVGKTADATVLAGGEIDYALTIANPSTGGAVPLYNASFSDTLPLGVCYVPGSAAPFPDPGRLFDPATGRQVLVFRNLEDVAVADSVTVTFKGTTAETANNPCKTNQPIVGQTLVNDVVGVASSDPREIPDFDSVGQPVLKPGVDYAGTSAAATQVTAIEIEKTEPSPESELLRGVHDQRTTYTLEVRNNGVEATTDITVTDYLPAGLEFLGCGTQDNTTPGSRVEYTGAPRLGVPPLSIPDCPTPVSVETVLNPPAQGTQVYPPGVYTKVTWQVGVLQAQGKRKINYVAGIPLQANEMFPGTPPTPSSGEQGSNLDNNTGPSTREGQSESALVNYARAAGDYQGPNTTNPGQPVAVSDATDHMVTREDVRLLKSVSPKKFASAGPQTVATFTLDIDVSEYVTAAGIVVTDVLPDGYCPLGGDSNYAPDLGSDCNPEGGAAPTGASYDLVQFDAQTGQYDITFTPIAAIPDNGSATITFKARMRDHYSAAAREGQKTVAGDSFTNTATLAAATNPVQCPGEVSCTSESGAVAVGDASSAEQQTDAPVLVKTMKPRTTEGGAVIMDPDCSVDSGYGDPADWVGTTAENTEKMKTFRKGDKLCFKIEVQYPTTIDTRNSVVTDFLPRGSEFITGSDAELDGNTVQAAFSSPQGTPVWLVGTPQGQDPRFVEPGAVFSHAIAAVVTDPAEPPLPDLTGNLAKFSFANAAGVVDSRRDMVDFQIAPGSNLDLLKGVYEVTNPATLPGAGPNPADTDGATVQQAATVTYRIDLTNELRTGFPGADFSAHGIQAVDVLPEGVACPATPNYRYVPDYDPADEQTPLTGILPLPAGFASCAPANPGESNILNPSFGDSKKQAVITWTFPNLDAYEVHQGNKATLLYDVVMPGTISVSGRLDNNAGVSTFTSETNQSGAEFTSYYPQDNILAVHDEDTWNAQAADDDSYVITSAASVAKSGITAIVENNNNEPTQATIGERVRYSYSVTIPAQTSVHNGSLTDALPTGLTLLSDPAAVLQFYPDATLPGTSSLPGGVTLTPASGAVAFGNTYTNATATAQKFEVVAWAVVTTSAATAAQNNVARTNTARFASDTKPTGGTAITPRTATYEIRVIQPSPSLAKAANPTSVTGGQQVTYRLTASNATGRPPMHDTVVVDCLPNQMVYGAVTSPPGADVTTTPGTGANGCAVNFLKITWNVGTVLAGAANNKVLTYTALAQSTPAAGDAYTNTASLSTTTISGTDSNERTFTRTANATVNVPGATGAKSVSPARATIGETVTYTVAINMAKDTAAYSAAIVDVLPAGLDPDVATVSVTCTYAGTTDPCAGIPPTGFGTPLPRVGQKVAWSFGDVGADSRNRLIVLVYTTTVLDIPSNSAGVTRTNSAQGKWNTTPGTVLVNADSTDALAKTTGVLQATATVIEPSMSVAKAVSNPTPGLADTFTYTVTATNAAGANVAPANDVLVVDTIPAGVIVNPASISDSGVLAGAGPTGGGTITWTLAGPIAAGAAEDLSYEASLADSTNLTAAGLTNTVDITEYFSLPSEGGRRYDNVTPATATVTPKFPHFTTDKAIVGGDEAIIGSPFGWRVTVTNTGAGAGFAVDVADVLPLNWTYDANSALVSVAGGPAAAIEPTISEAAGVQTLTWSDLGDLAPSQRIVVTFTATPTTAVITAPGVGNSIDHINSASATGDDADGNDANASGSYSGGPDTAMAHISAADLAVDKVLVDPIPPITQEVVAGTQFSWQVTVTNVGPDESHSPITVTDLIPAGLQFVSATGTGWSCAVAADNVTVGCVRSQGVLAAATSAPAITVTVAVPSDTASGTNFQNVATVTATTLDPNPGNNTDRDTVITTASADVWVRKTTVTDPVVAGQQIRYTLQVGNDGPSTSRGPITVTDTLPTGVSFTEASGSGWLCRALGQDVTCTHDGDLLALAEPTLITVTGTVAADTPAASQLQNNATVTPTTPDPDPDNNTSEVTDPTTALADLAIIKSHPELPEPVAGEPFTFTLTVSNDGPSDAAGPIVITDDVPAGMTFNSGGGDGFTCTASPDNDPGSTVTCTRAAGLAAGPTALAPTITFNIDDDATVDELVNTASVSSATRDPNPGNNTSTDAINPSALVDLVAHKRHANPEDPVLAGDEVTFDLTFDNDGPSVEAGPVSIIDPIPVGMTWTGKGASDAGWTCSLLLVSPDLPNGGVGCSHQSATGMPFGTNVMPKLQLTFQIAPDVSIIDTEITNSVTITGTSPEQETGNNTDTDTVFVNNLADLVLTKIADPTTVTAGQDATFKIDISNRGPSAAYLVQVTDTLPTGLTFQSASGTGWNCDGAGQQVVCTSTDRAHQILMPGDAETITVVATVSPSVADGSVLTNQATVETVTPEESTADNTDSADIDVSALADLVLTKSRENADDPVYAGTTVTFKLDVVNNGPSDAQGPIEIVDTIPAGFTFLTADAPWVCAPGAGVDQVISCTLSGATSLAAGGSAPTLRMDVAVDADADPGEYQNSAVVSSQTTDSDPGNNEDEIDVPVTALADLEVSKTHTGTAVIGEEMQFQIAVTNHGPSAAAGVQIVDTLPSGLSYVSATGTDWTCSNTGPDPQVVTCDLTGTLLGAAAPITLTVDVTASAYPSVVNNVEVTSTTPEPTPDPHPNTDDDTLVVAPLSDLWLTKTHTGAAVVGQQLTFQLTVGNDGPTSDPGPITVIDTLPVGLDFVSASGTNWDCSHDRDSKQVRCELPAGDPALAAQDTSEITLVTTVTAAAYPQVENAANVDSPAADPNPENNTAVDPVAVDPRVDLTITKTHTGGATVGSEATFTLTVGNNGPTDDPGPITVTDTLPAGLELVTVAGTGWVCAPAAPILCTRADPLPIGVSSAITVVARVGAAAYPTASNTARVSSPAVDVDPANNTATDEVVVAALVDLWVTKTHTGQPSVGGAVAFTLTVGNGGPTADPGPVVVTDTLPTGLTFSSATGTGWTCQATGQVVSCALAGSLGAGATTTITVSALVGAGAYPSVTNAVSVTSPAVDTDPANNSATDQVGVTPVSNLSIVKELAALQDDSATWAIIVTNAGPSATTTPITVVDPLPSGLTFSSATGAGWSCAAAGTVVTCTHPEPLAARASARVEILTGVASWVTEVTNTAFLGAVGGVSDSAVIEPSSCGSDGAGSDCGGFGPAVPLRVKALKSQVKLVKGDLRKVVTSARSSKAELSTKVICRDAKGRKVKGCKITVGKANSVKLKVSRCAIRKATVTITATPNTAGYRSKFWTRTWRVRAC